MAREADAALQAKILQIGFVVVFVAAVLYGVRGMMFGSKAVAGIVAAFSLILAGVLILDREYWVLYPVISSSGLFIPRLPFDSAELACLVLVSVFCIRAVLRRDSWHFTSSRYVWYAVPYFLWILVIFILKPVGFHIFGSNTIGGRHYFHIVLGFMTLFVLSQIDLSEHGLKLLFAGLIVCVFIRCAVGYFGFLKAEDEIIEIHTRYYLESFGVLLSLLLCRYDLPKLLLSPGLLLVCLASFGLVVLSGRRTAVGTLLLTPFILMVLRRRGYRFTICCGVLGAILLGLLVVGHGRLYELPYSMQRSLSFLPGRWERSLEYMGFRDDFRSELQRRAKRIIREHPWVGRKGFAMDPREISWIVLYTGARDTMFGGHELAGNWHNKFYGMWADFGAVAPFSWYGFLVLCIFWGFRRRIEYPGDSYADTFFRYWFCLVFFDLILSYGHSAMTPFTLWPTFGLLLALDNMKRNQAANQPPLCLQDGNRACGGVVSATPDRTSAGSFKA